jgi:hypothetical protein
MRNELQHTQFLPFPVYYDFVLEAADLCHWHHECPPVLLTTKKKSTEKKEVCSKAFQGVYQDNEATIAAYAHAILLEPGDLERFMKFARRA